MCIDEDLLILLFVGSIVYISLHHSRFDIMRNDPHYASAKQMTVETETPLPSQVKNVRKHDANDATNDEERDPAKDDTDNPTTAEGDDKVGGCRTSLIQGHRFPRTRQSQERLLKRMNGEMNSRLHQYE